MVIWMGLKLGYISSYKLQSNVDFYVSPGFRRGFYIAYSHFFEIQLKLWPGCCRTTTWPVYHRLQREFKKTHTLFFFFNTLLITGTFLCPCLWYLTKTVAVCPKSLRIFAAQRVAVHPEFRSPVVLHWGFSGHHDPWFIGRWMNNARINSIYESIN